MALALVALSISCGDTGSKPSSTGKVFVFQARARLNLIAQVAPDDPKILHITATLLDPQGNPFRNQRVTFEAEFPDAIFTPPNPTQNDLLACLDRSGTGNSTRCTNRGAAITDDNGQAKVTLFAIVGSTNAPSNPRGQTCNLDPSKPDCFMRVIAEAPNSLDVASAVSVPFTALGFIIGGTTLAITPPAATFVNPLVQPGTDGPTVTFTVQGGRPPYRWDNQNKALGKLTPTSPPTDFNQQFVYTIVGAIPTTTAGPLTDTVTVTDAAGNTKDATVTVIFADCTLKANGEKLSIIPSADVNNPTTFSVNVSDGVPPFTTTEDFPGTLAGPAQQKQCSDNSEQICSLLFTLSVPPTTVNPDNIIIRDSRGCTAQVALTTNLCGNRKIDGPGEQCDAPDFGELTDSGCGGLTGANGLPRLGGPLRCSATCTLDTSLCVDAPTPTTPSS